MHPKPSGPGSKNRREPEHVTKRIEPCAHDALCACPASDEAVKDVAQAAGQVKGGENGHVVPGQNISNDMKILGILIPGINCPGFPVHW